MKELQNYPDCFLCGNECDENYTKRDNECVCTECNNSEDNKFHYGTIENLVKDIKRNESLNKV